jgi:site-specific DNA recombinase
MPASCGRRRNRKADAGALYQDVAASYARYSSDQQDAKSIDDQQRPCRVKADGHGNHIPDELQFADEAVSGTKLKRDGFDRMLKAAEEGRFKTLYFFDLSRLARESVITITTLKKLVYVYKVRVVSVSEGIDSANEGWFTLATILGLQHEQYLKTLSANVLRVAKRFGGPEALAARQNSMLCMRVGLLRWRLARPIPHLPRIP